MKKIRLDIKKNIHSIINHNAICIPLAKRTFFPDANFFILKTDVNTIETRMIGAKIQSELKPWSKKHRDSLSKDDVLEIKMINKIFLAGFLPTMNILGFLMMFQDGTIQEIWLKVNLK